MAKTNGQITGNPTLNKAEQAALRKLGLTSTSLNDLQSINIQEGAKTRNVSPQLERDRMNYGISKDIERNYADAIGQVQGGEWWRAIGRGVVNFAPNVVQSFAYLPEIIDPAQDYDNPVIRATQAMKDYGLGIDKVYERDSSNAWDIGDKAFWWNNGVGLVESAAQFATIGGGYAKAMSFIAQQLSKIGKVVGAAKKTSSIARAANNFGVSLALAYTEGAMSGNEVYKDIYNDKLAKGFTIADAENMAAKASSSTVMLNASLNTALNMFAMTMLTKGLDKLKTRNPNNITAKNAAQIDEAMGNLGSKGSAATRGAKDLTEDSFSNIINSLNAIKYSTTKTEKAIGALGVLSETGGESLEELVNVAATATGKRRGSEEYKDLSTLSNLFLSYGDFFKNFSKDIDTDEGKLSAVLGAIGGLGQSQIVNRVWAAQNDFAKLDADGNVIYQQATAEQIADENTPTVKIGEGENAQHYLADENGKPLVEIDESLNSFTFKPKGWFAKEGKEVQSNRIWNSKKIKVAKERELNLILGVLKSDLTTMRDNSKIIDTLSAKENRTKDEELELSNAKSKVASISNYKSVNAGYGEYLGNLYQSLSLIDNTQDVAANYADFIESIDKKREEQQPDAIITPDEELQYKQAEEKLQSFTRFGYDVNKPIVVTEAMELGFAQRADEKGSPQLRMFEHNYKKIQKLNDFYRTHDIGQKDTRDAAVYREVFNAIQEFMDGEFNIKEYTDAFKEITNKTEIRKKLDDLKTKAYEYVTKQLLNSPENIELFGKSLNDIEEDIFKLISNEGAMGIIDSHINSLETKLADTTLESGKGIYEYQIALAKARKAEMSKQNEAIMESNNHFGIVDKNGERYASTNMAINKMLIDNLLEKEDDDVIGELLTYAGNAELTRYDVKDAKRILDKYKEFDVLSRTDEEAIAAWEELNTEINKRIKRLEESGLYVRELSNAFNDAIDNYKFKNRTDINFNTTIWIEDKDFDTYINAVVNTNDYVIEMNKQKAKIESTDGLSDEQIKDLVYKASTIVIKKLAKDLFNFNIDDFARRSSEVAGAGIIEKENDDYQEDVDKFIKIRGKVFEDLVTYDYIKDLVISYIKQNNPDEFDYDTLTDEELLNELDDKMFLSKLFKNIKDYNNGTINVKDLVTKKDKDGNITTQGIFDNTAEYLLFTLPETTKRFFEENGYNFYSVKLNGDAQTQDTKDTTEDNKDNEEDDNEQIPLDDDVKVTDDTIDKQIDNQIELSLQETADILNALNSLVISFTNKNNETLLDKITSVKALIADINRIIKIADINLSTNTKKLVNTATQIKNILELYNQLRIKLGSEYNDDLLNKIKVFDNNKELSDINNDRVIIKLPANDDTSEIGKKVFNKIKGIVNSITQNIADIDANGHLLLNGTSVVSLDNIINGLSKSIEIVDNSVVNDDIQAQIEALEIERLEDVMKIYKPVTNVRRANESFNTVTIIPTSNPKLFGLEVFAINGDNREQQFRFEKREPFQESVFDEKPPNRANYKNNEDFITSYNIWKKRKDIFPENEKIKRKNYENQVKDEDIIHTKYNVKIAALKESTKQDEVVETNEPLTNEQDEADKTQLTKDATITVESFKHDKPYSINRTTNSIKLNEKFLTKRYNNGDNELNIKYKEDYIEYLRNMIIIKTNNPDITNEKLKELTLKEFNEPLTDNEVKSEAREIFKELYPEISFNFVNEPNVENKREFETANDKIFNQEVDKNKLITKLYEFLNTYNFQIKSVDDLKILTGYDAIAATDLLYKTVLINNNVNAEKLLIKEVAYVAYSLLGKKNKIKTDLMMSVSNLSNYINIYNDYKSKNPNLNDYKIKELIIIDFLADSIYNNYTTPIDSYINRTSEYWSIKGNSPLAKRINYQLAKFKRFIKNLLNLNKLSEQEVNDILNDISNDILNNLDTKFNGSLSATQQLTNYNNTVAKDTKAKEIIEFIQSKDILLTGSLSLRGQGTVYRTSDENIHDLDFTVPYSVFKEDLEKLTTNRDKEINEIKKQFLSTDPNLQRWLNTIYVKYENLIDSIIENSEWFKDIKSKYPTLSKIRSFGGSLETTITWTGIIDDKYMIDFFLTSNEDLGVENVNGFQNWQSIFKAKLKMGRAKDIKDFINYLPFKSNNIMFAQDVGFRHFNFEDLSLKINNNITNNQFIFNQEVQSNYQLNNPNEFAASEKTIRDLATKLSDRIGINVEFENDVNLKYKGKIVGNTAYVNLANATLDTPIHEILGHPIIRSIKRISQDKYSKESFTYKGNNYKTEEGFFENSYYRNGETIDEEEFNKAVKENLLQSTSLYQNLLKELETGRGSEVFDRIKKDYPLTKTWYNVVTRSYGISRTIETFDTIEEARAFAKQSNDYYIDKLTKKGITLEEQQEEAIVELLGLYTADKLNKVKDGKLISLLKRLLKEMKSVIRSLINQKEIEIAKLPDNITINDLADILAYSNSKLILPNYEVVYTTPDNVKFKTYTEASKHISNLVKSVKDVDLSNVGINNVNVIDRITNIDDIKVNSFSGTDTDGVPFYVEKIDNKWYISYTKETLLTEFNDNMKEPSSNSIIVSHYNQFLIDPIKSFIEKNKEFEQSKDIIEEWKQVNNIQYNPEEVYSRGQEFVSIVGAYSDFDVNLMMQNLLAHIEDNQKAGGQFAVSAITKPIDRKIYHLEEDGGKIKFKIYPQSNDILWASTKDVYSGSVWDASEKVNKDKESELVGVSYTKYPALRNVESIEPNLANIIDKLSHHHNELGIVLTGSNFRLEYDDDIPYSTKKIVDGINSILDQKYGKLVKPKIENANPIQPTQTEETVKESITIVQMRLDSREKALPEKFVLKGEYLGYDADTWYYKINNEWYLKNVPFNAPFDTIVEDWDIRKLADIGLGIDELWDSYLKTNFEGIEVIEIKDEKEYSSQALINTKIAALKEVAKKYPRSLIRSEVKSDNSYEELFDDEMYQKNTRNQQTNEGEIIGQANIEALTVLVDYVKGKTDTIPHEYAHHYIAWFKNTPIVQAAINKWGSEEELVQAIGEDVATKIRTGKIGQALEWWNNFKDWLKTVANLKGDYKKADKDKLLNLLSTAFLNRYDLTELDNDLAKQGYLKATDKPKKFNTERLYKLQSNAVNSLELLNTDDYVNKLKANKNLKFATDLLDNIDLKGITIYQKTTATPLNISATASYDNVGKIITVPKDADDAMKMHELLHAITIDGINKIFDGVDNKDEKSEAVYDYMLEVLNTYILDDKNVLFKHLKDNSSAYPYLNRIGAKTLRKQIADKSINPQIVKGLISEMIAYNSSDDIRASYKSVTSNVYSKLKTALGKIVASIINYVYNSDADDVRTIYDDVMTLTNIFISNGEFVKAAEAMQAPINNDLHNAVTTGNESAFSSILLDERNPNDDEFVDYDIYNLVSKKRNTLESLFELSTEETNKTAKTFIITELQKLARKLKDSIDTKVTNKKINDFKATAYLHTINLFDEVLKNSQQYINGRSIELSFNDIMNTGDLTVMSLPDLLIRYDNAVDTKELATINTIIQFKLNLVKLINVFDKDYVQFLNDVNKSTNNEIKKAFTTSFDDIKRSITTKLDNILKVNGQGVNENEVQKREHKANQTFSKEVINMLKAIKTSNYSDKHKSELTMLLYEIASKKYHNRPQPTLTIGTLVQVSSGGNYSTPYIIKDIVKGKYKLVSTTDTADEITIDNERSLVNYTYRSKEKAIGNADANGKFIIYAQNEINGLFVSIGNKNTLTVKHIKNPNKRYTELENAKIKNTITKEVNGLKDNSERDNSIFRNNLTTLIKPIISERKLKIFELTEKFKNKQELLKKLSSVDTIRISRSTETLEKIYKDLNVDTNFDGKVLDINHLGTSFISLTDAQIGRLTNAKDPTPVIVKSNALTRKLMIKFMKEIDGEIFSFESAVSIESPRAMYQIEWDSNRVNFVVTRMNPAILYAEYKAAKEANDNVKVLNVLIKFNNLFAFNLTETVIIQGRETNKKVDITDDYVKSNQDAIARVLTKLGKEYELKEALYDEFIKLKDGRIDHAISELNTIADIIVTDGVLKSTEYSTFDKDTFDIISKNNVEKLNAKAKEKNPKLFDTFVKSQKKNPFTKGMLILRNLTIDNLDKLGKGYGALGVNITLKNTDITNTIYVGIINSQGEIIWTIAGDEFVTEEEMKKTIDKMFKGDNKDKLIALRDYLRSNNVDDKNKKYDDLSKDAQQVFDLFKKSAKIGDEMNTGFKILSEKVNGLQGNLDMSLVGGKVSVRLKIEQKGKDEIWIELASQSLDEFLNVKTVGDTHQQSMYLEKIRLLFDNALKVDVRDKIKEINIKRANNNIKDLLATINDDTDINSTSRVSTLNTIVKIADNFKSKLNNPDKTSSHAKFVTAFNYHIPLKNVDGFEPEWFIGKIRVKVDKNNLFQAGQIKIIANPKIDVNSEDNQENKKQADKILGVKAKSSVVEKDIEEVIKENTNKFETVLTNLKRIKELSDNGNELSDNDATLYDLYSDLAAIVNDKVIEEVEITDDNKIENFLTFIINEENAKYIKDKLADFYIKEIEFNDFVSICK